MLSVTWGQEASIMDLKMEIDCICVNDCIELITDTLKKQYQARN